MTTSPATELEQLIADYQAKAEATRIRVPYMRNFQVHDTGDGPLIVCVVNYGVAKEAEVLSGAALAIEATLTEDGRYYNTRGWHDGPAAHEDWIRVERWGLNGREFHGFIHRESRKLLQAG
jgi:hypothetical protein